MKGWSVLILCTFFLSSGLGLPSAALSESAQPQSNREAATGLSEGTSEPQQQLSPEAKVESKTESGVVQQVGTGETSASAGVALSQPTLAEGNVNGAKYRETSDVVPNVDASSQSSESSSTASNSQMNPEFPEASPNQESQTPPSAVNTVSLDSQGGFWITKAFFINRGRDWERREKMEKELKRVGLNYERIEGVSPDDLCSHRYDYLIQGGSRWAIDCSNHDKTHQRNMRSMCCDVAHRVAIERISHEQDGIYLLLEDDIHFEDGWKETLAHGWGRLPSDWTVARAGYWGLTDSKDKVNDMWYAANRHTPNNEWDSDRAYYYGGHALVLDPPHARRMLGAMVSRRIEMFDQFTANGAIGPSYTLTKNVININGMRSVKELGMRMLGVEPEEIFDLSAEQK